MDVTELNITADNLYLLNNLSSYPNLKSLFCAQANISSLDLSQAPKLEVLYCGGNLITELDCSYVPNLRELNCLYNQFLTKLNLSNCTKLVILQCDFSALQTLDVSKCPQLKELTCGSCNLRRVKLDKNIHLQTLVVSGNLLREINLFGLLTLQDFNCDDNKLKYIDLSTCPSLLTLRCNNNKLTELDLSTARQLTTLYCINNKIRNINVNGCYDLTTFNCDHNELTELPLLLRQLKRITNLSYDVDKILLNAGQYMWKHTNGAKGVEVLKVPELPQNFGLFAAKLADSENIPDVDKYAYFVKEYGEEEPWATVFKGVQINCQIAEITASVLADDSIPVRDKYDIILSQILSNFPQLAEEYLAPSDQSIIALQNLGEIDMMKNDIMLSSTSDRDKIHMFTDAVLKSDINNKKQVIKKFELELAVPTINNIYNDIVNDDNIENKYYLFLETVKELYPELAKKDLQQWLTPLQQLKTQAYLKSNIEEILASRSTSDADKYLAVLQNVQSNDGDMDYWLKLYPELQTYKLQYELLQEVQNISRSDVPLPAQNAALLAYLREYFPDMSRTDIRNWLNYLKSIQ